MGKRKIGIAAIGIVGIVALALIHSRTPFFLNQGGPWSVGYGFSDTIPASVSPQASGLFTPEKLRIDDAGTRFLADPFFIHERDSFYIFFEHKHFTPHKANIAVLSSVDGINYKFGGTVLDEPFHLSYPQVFRYKGKIYMVPESAAAGSVLLYSPDKFPKGWKVCDTLVKRPLKDPSIYLSDTLNIMVGSDDKLSLYLYKADSLDGEWKFVKRILRGSEARAGGRIFAANGELYLPVQNCRRGYGSALSLYKFNFGADSPELRKVSHEYLHAQNGIPQLAFGMHQFDIQKVGDRYYYVYDGNRIKSTDKKQAIWYSLKLTYNDFMNIFR